MDLNSRNRKGLVASGAVVSAFTSEQAQRRVTFCGEEEQGSGRMTSFFAIGTKRRRSKVDFAPTWQRTLILIQMNLLYRYGVQNHFRGAFFERTLSTR